MQACSVLHVAHVVVRLVTVVIVHIGHEDVVVVIHFCVAIFVRDLLHQEMFSLHPPSVTVNCVDSDRYNHEKLCIKFLLRFMPQKKSWFTEYTSSTFHECSIHLCDDVSCNKVVCHCHHEEELCDQFSWCVLSSAFLRRCKVDNVFLKSG